MIVATAGHVDHGKTSLIRALTGVETDRLPEERARGMTIDLGFAYLPTATGEVIGFIDVPGHERFVRNMLAGVAGIDFALLVVAADDGPMPQTREHLAILDLLGIRAGVVALTKVDRVDPAQAQAVAQDITALLAGTGLADAPIVACAAPLGTGIAALREVLYAAQKQAAERTHAGHFRLAIDRNFVLDGAGRVVTGTVYSGSAQVGDRLLIAPSGMEVRIRSIHAQNRRASVARAGERCGINLTGADLRRYEVHRGDWLVAPALASTALRLGVALTLCASEIKALQERASVHVHLGAADILGRVTLLRDGPLPPGASCYANLTLEAPVVAVHGDRFVLRDPSATRTLGGGRVLEALPFPRSLTRAKRLELFDALANDTPAHALRTLLTEQAEGVEASWFARCRNLSEAEASAAQMAVDASRVALPDGDCLLVETARWQALQLAIEQAVSLHHEREPAHSGLPEPQLAPQITPKTPTRLLRAASDLLVREGRLQRRGGQLCQPQHQAVLPPVEAALLARVTLEMERHGLQAPALHDLLVPLNIEVSVLRPFLERMARLGHLQQVGKYRFYLPRLLYALAREVEILAAQSAPGAFSVAEYRDHSGIGRNTAIEVLEYFDRIGLTRRNGQTRSLRQALTTLLGPPP